ncbi:MAG: HlyD family efflux transporter periplasmic adaptor subunit [Planctomycetota bacterium]
MTSRCGVLLLVCFALTSCGNQAESIQGVVEWDEQTLAFEVAGTVASVSVAEGQRVAGNSTVAMLDDQALRLSVADAEAQVTVAGAELARVQAPARTQELAAAKAETDAAKTRANIAEAERVRTETLVAQHLSSDRERDQARDAAARATGEAKVSAEHLALLEAGPRSEDIAVAAARLAAAHTALDRAKERLTRATLRITNGDRIVRHIHLHVGEVAQPGKPALTVADLDHPYVDAFVPQERLATLKVGGTATVTVDGGAAHQGAIERIGERLEFTPRYLFGPRDRPNLVARVRIRLGSGEGLHAGVPADVVFAK